MYFFLPFFINRNNAFKEIRLKKIIMQYNKEKPPTGLFKCDHINNSINNAVEII